MYVGTNKNIIQPNNIIVGANQNKSDANHICVGVNKNMIQPNNIVADANQNIN